MTTPNPVDLDALDAAVANHEHDWCCYDVCEAEKEVIDAYPALSAELRRLRGLVREYAEASDKYVLSTGSGSARLTAAAKALAAAGKEIAK